MRFSAKDHLGEGVPLVNALVEAGHTFSADGPTDLFLTDLDPDLFGYREVIDFYRECGAVVLQYPHGAPLSTLCYDNLYEPYCVDAATEILTLSGWVSHDQLRPGTVVMTLNHDTGESAWQPISSVNRFNVVDEEMLSLEGWRHSSLTTMDHRWPVLREHRHYPRLRDHDRYRKREWYTSASLRGSDLLVTGAPCADVPTEQTFSDAFVEAVAWFYTEGDIVRGKHTSQIRISQSESANAPFVDRIDRALTQLYGEPYPERMTSRRGTLAPPRWRRFPNRRPVDEMVRFLLNTAAASDLLEVAPNRVVSLDFIRTLTRSQLELFVEISLLADGNADLRHRSLGQKDPSRLDAFELAAILLGLTPRRTTRSSGMHDISLAKRMQTVGRARPKRTSYTGVVWCPTTRNGSWLARRNGTVFYTGNSGVDGQLTNGRGEIDFLRSIGIQRPAKVMGWQLCQQFELRRTDAPRRVVFAPTHVNADGGLDGGRREQNASVFRQLLEGDWELVVRYIGELEKLGLWEDEGVFRYVQGDRDMTTVEVDVADCVVAGAGTYPCLALARGCPAVMYGQFSAAMYGLPAEQPKPLRNLEKYRDQVLYPFDVDAAARPWSALTLNGMIDAACRSPQAEKDITEWADRWIGRPLDGPAFAKMVEEWIPELRARRDVQVALVH